ATSSTLRLFSGLFQLRTSVPMSQRLRPAPTTGRALAATRAPPRATVPATRPARPQRLTLAAVLAAELPLPAVLAAVRLAVLAAVVLPVVVRVALAAALGRTGPLRIRSGTALRPQARPVPIW